MERKFIVFINPVSGTKSKAGARAVVIGALTENNFPFEVLPTERSGDYSFLGDKIATEKITDVIICGGDGTVSAVCNYLRGTLVRAGIVPLGSGNGLAFAAGIPRSPKSAMKIIIRGNALPTDAFLINGKFSCMLAGIGFDARVAHDFAAQPSRGVMTYIRQTLRGFFSAKPYPFVISTVSGEIRTAAFFISIANGNQFGNHFTIAPKAALRDGLLDIVVAGKSSKAAFVINILAQVRGGRITAADDAKKTVRYFHAKELSISNPELAPLHIDGEPAETSAEIQVKILPKAFRLII